MATYKLQIIQKIPLLRPLVALSVGIVTSYHLQLKAFVLLFAFTVTIILVVLFAFLLPQYFQYKYNWLRGIIFYLIFICIGSLLVFIKNENNKATSLNNITNAPKNVLLTLQEPITVKEKSFKTIAQAEAIFINNQWQPVSGNVLLYFKKQDSLPQLQYGSQIIVTATLQNIGNSGNPGTFNYREYCLFQGIVKQAFLNKKDYINLNQQKIFFLNEWIFFTRDKMLNSLRSNISGNNELSLAEALLIGYRDDLDRDLVKAYSNTGVVHIIAISGMHLGMIYGLLLLLFKPFAKFKSTKIIKPIIIVLVLWSFSFIAGAAPSILRSAVMFSFIAVGESFGKRSNIYNNLAASAFVIILFNPFSLWDVGFQLSYAAVLSIVLFSKHINNWFYFKNKLLKNFWSLNAVTLSAQILTLPFVLYHFHQFPVLFLVTNLVAVPLSGFILYGELVILFFAWWQTAAHFVGVITQKLIMLLNSFIQHINNFPFAVWPNLQINIMQALLLFLLLAFMGAWLLNKKTHVLISGLIAGSIFFGIRCFDFIKREQQQKIIVYNVPQHKAIDIINGRNYQFIGDSILKEDGFLRNFHLQPSRIKHRITAVNNITPAIVQPSLIQINNKSFLLINDKTSFNNSQQKITVNAVIISGNPQLYLNNLMKYVDCKIIVADATNPLWKIGKWKKDAEQLHLQLHSVPDEGAFEMNL
ncbi:MAG: ComEC family competence protein [Bacteroidetes bacterium]|nr:ComEC family competence protein [Bacteroidota bacterium]MBS1649112.1 ComEC family competence protein [Bacteroidota bacterium]